MCGIAGGVNVPANTVLKMLDSMQSRGPDNRGLKQVGDVVFGHQRLSIVDKSENGNQPMLGGFGTTDSFRNLLFVYNGEIYNDLGDFKCDTNWLFNKVLFNTDLEQVLNSLNGMFAFAFYDDETITLVRDRFGVKPLYYTIQPDYFAFASTPGAVSLTKSDWKLSEAGLYEYLSLGATQENSMFEGIRPLQAGHYLTYSVKTKEVKIKRWYHPKFIENAYEKIEGLVLAAIEKVKLTCDEPQTVLLSGGIDSSLVASRYHGRSAIHLRSPEQAYAEKVSEKFDIKLTVVDPQEANAEECLTDYVTKCGDPTMAGLIPFITCREIARQGFRVAITANGADELFYGYDRMKGDKMEQLSAIFRPLGMDFTDCYRKSAQNIELDYYLTHDLNKTLDFASMCHSVEVRVPYLDHELVEAACSLRMDQHVGQYGNKTILKRMVRELGFDWDFIHRPKMGFSLHSQPQGWEELQERAMKWYQSTEYPQLSTASGRQESYHRFTVAGLYVFMKVFKFV